jgi:hypothetical protein
MTKVDPKPRLMDSGALWFAVSGGCSMAGVWLGRHAGLRNYAPGAAYRLMVLASLALLVLAGLAAWQLFRRRADSWLLPLAALNLLLLEPGRAGDVATWRLEWGVFGLAWTLIAVLLFTRLLRRTDELQRHIHLEGAAIGLGLALIAATAYALFEQLLPPLRAQWVVMALLLLWWGGWLATARRYR